MNLNKATLIGNLTQDPVQRPLPSGQTITVFGLATNTNWKDARTNEKKVSTEFHDIVSWGRLADICAKYLKKGSRVYVEGRLKTRSWNDKTGTKRSKTEIIADNLIMLGHRTAKTADATAEKTNVELAPSAPNLDEAPV